MANILYTGSLERNNEVAELFFFSLSLSRALEPNGYNGRATFLCVSVFARPANGFLLIKKKSPLEAGVRLLLATQKHPQQYFLSLHSDLQNVCPLAVISFNAPSLRLRGPMACVQLGVCLSSLERGN